ncbi:sentrin-specific protease 7-like isoform 3-T4 [Spinachia spinachia]
MSMASSFKIPKKKHPAAPESAPLHTSPLSRLQSSTPQFRSYGNQYGRADGMHAGSSANGESAPLFREVVKTLLGLTANQREASAADRNGGQSAKSYAASPSNGWRPKRALDCLLPPDLTSRPPSPQLKEKSHFSAVQSIYVDSLDSLAELRGEMHVGTLSSSATGDGTTGLHSAERKGRRSLGRGAWLSSSQMKDVRERERRKWKEFREKKTSSFHLHLKKPRNTPMEPIVLSSEEEEEEEEEGDGGNRVEQTGGEGENGLPLPPPSFLQLDFVCLHVGLTHADANGKITITENGIILPLKGVEDGEIAVVASQLRGHGVWDGGVAQGGFLLGGWKGPAPSLLFLWVTDTQANLLQKELSSIQASTSESTCPFLLLVLKEQLQELQTALLASILEMGEYKKASSFGGPTSPLEWTDGLLLLHSCPPPLDQHLLGLLGHSAMSDNQKNTKTNLGSSGLQQLPTRLIQYPAAPSKGRITVTNEDLACLSGGEFLNDVIIDFYLKFLLLEGVGRAVAERSHVFSSFFYKQLSRRRVAGEDNTPSVPDLHVRHQRVKTWTRHVDIFTKDFLFVPVNQEAHWYLAVVCFPGLEDVHYRAFQRARGVSKLTAGKASSLGLRPQQPPECTEQSWQRDTVLRRPCILVMDSLKLSGHENVCRLLRDYLQVEWEVRRGTPPRLFTSDNVRSSSCRVPQQDNSSDCGVYLLQYAESFLQVTPPSDQSLPQNPVVCFDLPLRLERWFPRQQVRQKREEIRTLIMTMHRSQMGEK